MKRPSQRLARLMILAAVLYWGGLFLASHLPVGAWMRHLGHADKLFHFLGYAGLTLLISAGIWMQHRLTPAILISVGVTLSLYGVIDELLQHPIPGRTTDPYDWLADLAGIALVLALIAVTQWAIRRGAPSVPTPA